MLPEAFLRGCGIPELLITFMPSLLAGPSLQFASCFISYSTKDQEFADRLHNDLQAKGIRCWFAPKDIRIGDRFRQRIEEAIQFHDRLMLILSEHSVARSWVRDEVETCLERETRERRIILFPIRLDDAVETTQEAWASLVRRQRHIGDFREWKRYEPYREGLTRLLRDLQLP